MGGARWAGHVSAELGDPEHNLTRVVGGRLSKETTYTSGGGAHGNQEE